MEEIKETYKWKQREKQKRKRKWATNREKVNRKK